MKAVTTIEQWLSEQEKLISKVFAQIEKAIDLEEDEAARKLRAIKKASPFHWKYAINRLDSESRQYALELARKHR